MLTLLLSPAAARAGCPMPDGAPDAVAGDIAFNNDEGVLQYCDGSDWIGTSGGGDGGSAAWADITGKPPGFADGIDDGITTETDPKVGTLTDARWCRSDGTRVLCDRDPAGAGTDTLADLACSSGQIAAFNGTQWVCASGESGGGGGGIAAACPAGFAAMQSAGRVLGCMQSAIEGSDDHVSASQNCFLTYGGRLPTLTERYISKHPSIGIALPAQEWLGAAVGAEGECPRLDPNDEANSSDCDDAMNYRCFIPADSLVADPGPDSCTLDGQTVAHGASHTFYSSRSNNDCAGISQVRTCNDGTLDGDPGYQYASCGAGCNVAPWGAIDHGASVTAFQAATVSNAPCVKQTRTCTDGTLSGTYAHDNCEGTYSNSSTCPFCLEDPGFNGGSCCGMTCRYMLQNDAASLNRRCWELGFTSGVVLSTFPHSEWCTYCNARTRYWNGSSWVKRSCIDGNVKQARCIGPR